MGRHMSKVATSIEITDLSTKWGLVTVMNEHGGIGRQFVISAEDAERIREVNNTVPPGCTDDEWFSGLARVDTKCCNPGQAVVMPDGTLMVNHGREVSAGRVTARVMAVPKEEWSLIDGVVYVEANVVADMPGLPGA